MMIEEYVNYIVYVISFLIFLLYLRNHIKCFLGFHKYGDWVEHERFFYDDEAHKSRVCKRCFKKEESYYIDTDFD